MNLQKHSNNIKSLKISSCLDVLTAYILQIKPFFRIQIVETMEPVNGPKPWVIRTRFPISKILELRQQMV